MATGTRFNMVRLDRKLSRALSHVHGDTLLNSYLAIAKDVNRPVELAIQSSGRGGSHNSEFANQEERVFRARSDRINVLVGWLNPPEHARERGSGGKLWYQYQDAGFHLFGGSRWIDGVGATIDRRENLIEGIERANRTFLRELGNILS